MKKTKDFVGVDTLKSAHTSKARQNKGITLISLVITIVVMLILVAVTISMAINGGLFEKSGEAVVDTQNAIDKEQEFANLEEDMTVNELIDKYTSGNEGTGITASTMQSNLASYLGQIVNYGVTYDDQSVNSYGGRKWEIFYADEEHIYIITRGHLGKNILGTQDVNGVSYNGTSDFTVTGGLTNYPAVAQGLLNKTYDPAAAGTEADPYLKYSSKNSNMKATQYLLDSRRWTTYVNEYADWAIGGPTQEIFVKSYNASNLSTTDVTLDAPSNYGYNTTPFSSSGSVPQGSYLNHYTSKNNSPSCYWLACPAGGGPAIQRAVFGDDGIVSSGGALASYPLRPLVCLDSNVKLTLNETTGEYDLSWN